MSGPIRERSVSVIRRIMKRPQYAIYWQPPVRRPSNYQRRTLFNSTIHATGCGDVQFWSQRGDPYVPGAFHDTIGEYIDWRDSDAAQFLSKGHGALTDFAWTPAGTQPTYFSQLFYNNGGHEHSIYGTKIHGTTGAGFMTGTVHGDGGIPFD